MQTTRTSAGGRGRGGREARAVRSRRAGFAEPPGGPSRSSLGCTIAIVSLLLAVGCTAVQRVPKQKDQAYLHLRVEPESAEVYVDGEYRGTVEGWVENAVPVEPGDRRLKLSADGYISRRFDVEIEAGESKVLELEMEPNLERLRRDAGSSRAHPRRGPPPPGRGGFADGFGR